MTYSEAHSQTRSVTGPLGRFLAKLGAKLGQGLIEMAENDPRMKQMRELHALSDEQLAARGLKREDIARHVLGPHYFL